MRTKAAAAVIFALALLLAGASTAWAKDAVKAAVVPISPTPQLMQTNGNEEYHAGTYSVGTIQIWYTVNAFEFPVGSFGSFTLNMQDLQVSTTGRNPEYPVTLSLSQTGSNNLTLEASPASHTVTAPSGGTYWSDSSTISITIPSGVSNDNGTVLVGNLQMSTPAGSHLDTVTTIQVKILLVHPTNCFNVFHFVSDQDFTQIQPATTVRLRNGNINSTSPGQFADNVIVTNTCGVTHSFDLRYTLDSRFETNPSGNPGNAVFTFVTSNLETPSSSLTVYSSGSGTPQGQQLCLQNMNVPDDSTFLATVHMAAKKVTVGSSPFSFTAQLFEATTAPASCASGGAHSLAPSAVNATLPFTIQ